MTIKLLIKRSMADTFSICGYSKKKIKKNGYNGYVIIMYHRIISPEKISNYIHPGMYVDPTTFKRHLDILVKEFTPIALSELNDIDSLRKKKNIQKPFCVLTFDDGWEDFYRNAFPLLCSYNFPATVFLPTDFIGTNKRFWTDRLADLLVKSDSLQSQRHKSSSLVLTLLRLRGSLSRRLELAIEILKRHSEQEIEEVLDDLANLTNAESSVNYRVFLNWQEVRSMKKTGLIEFGSHTCGHRILTGLDYKELWTELKKSKEKLLFEKGADQNWLPFCYPNGNYNQESIKALRALGYHIAVTTELGWNSFQTSRFVLSRIGLHQDISSTPSMLSLRLANVL